MDYEVEFTKKVKEYIDKGYVICTKTMAGIQDEMARVDFRKGDEFIRIAVYRNYIPECYYIKVGKLMLTKDYFLLTTTVWNVDLDIIETITVKGNGGK